MSPKKILLFTVFLFLCALFFYFDLGSYLTLASLKSNRALLVKFHERHRFLMASIFIIVYIIQTALSLPGAAVLSLAAGAVFGTVMGALYANIGATAGATLAFLLARYLFHDVVVKRFGSSLGKIDRELETGGFSYLLFLRLVPVFPFFLINIAAGLTKIPLRIFFWGTMIGIIPGSLVYCNAGSSLASISSVGQVVSLRVIGSFILLGIFALVPAIYRKIKGRT